MIPAVLRLMRPGDWAKNAFVLVPLVFWLAGDGRGDAGAAEQVLRGLLTAVAFSMAGSGFYCLNDVLDAHEDRMHPVKRHRPVASGAVSPRMAVAVGVALIVTGLAIAAWVRLAVLVALGVYVVLQVLYNARLKRVRMVDVATVASGFVLRAITGALAIGIAVSTWLVAVVFALTLFLGFVKRLGDLRAAQMARAAGEATDWKPRAGYDSAEDLNWLLAVTGALTMMTYLSYALSDHARGIFGVRATGFALLAPLVLVVIHRLYSRANSGKADSPVAAVLADGAARTATVLFGAGVLAVLFWPPAERAIGAVFQ
jgi:decaprenyl-phosphate phosphoribosyltransferase